MSNAQTAAFYDVDNTIMRGASIYHLARGLFAKGILTTSDLATYAVTQGKYLTSGSENKNDLARISANALQFAKGRTTDEMQQLCQEIFDDIMADKVWPGTVELAQQHKANGDSVWLVSAAPIELASIMADRLGLDGALGTVSEIVDDRYTGRLASRPMHGSEKSGAVARLAADNGWDLSQFFAYSDSANDIPLLSLVGHPSAVNPDGALRTHAREHGWPIHDFRREHLKAKAKPVGATALAVLGASVGLAVAVSRSRARRQATEA
jgi:HAD superfamily hydrolase (TIGR01490 family)